MLRSYATGVAAIVVVSVVWIAVQNAWQRAFPGVESRGCHGGGCTSSCDKRSCEQAEEGVS